MWVTVGWVGIEVQIAFLPGGAYEMMQDLDLDPLDLDLWDPTNGSRGYCSHPKGRGVMRPFVSVVKPSNRFA